MVGNLEEAQIPLLVVEAVELLRLAGVQEQLALQLLLGVVAVAEQAGKQQEMPMPRGVLGASLDRYRAVLALLHQPEQPAPTERPAVLAMQVPAVAEAVRLPRQPARAATVGSLAVELAVAARPSAQAPLLPVA